MTGWSGSIVSGERQPRRRLAASAALLALVAGCGADPASDPARSGPSSGQGGLPPAEPDEADARAPPATAPPDEPPAPPELTGPVRFEWPEAEPGAAPTCRAGRYAGSFECLYVPSGGAGGTPVHGSVELTLEESPRGEFLEVGNGRLDGAANLVFLFGADIVGELDCVTGRFEGGLVNGAYSGLLFINGEFQGPLAADYEASAHALINGFWELHEQGATSNGTCSGTWSAQWVP